MSLSLSVITVNFNNKLGLERTIESVIYHKDSIREYIVIDGGSDDGSIAILEAYKAQIDISISEVDNGIYNAMNKGIGIASSDYLLFVNSGDLLNPIDFISDIKPHFLKEWDIIYGDLNVKKSSRQSEAISIIYPDVLSFNFFLNKSLGHPSTFIKRQLFHDHGFYNESFKIVSDWAFFIILICINQVSYVHIPTTISTFFTDGISANPDFKPLLRTEREKVLEENFKLFIDDYESLSSVRSELRTIPSSILEFVKTSFGRKVMRGFARLLSSFKIENKNNKRY